jgi:hypothetical protein
MEPKWLSPREHRAKRAFMHALIGSPAEDSEPVN